MTETRQDKTNADIEFGEIRGFSHTAGYTRQAAATRLEWLLKADTWRLCGAGYDNINAFLRDVWRANDKGFRTSPPKTVRSSRGGLSSCRPKHPTAPSPALWARTSAPSGAIFRT